ncbi:MAG: prolipoprotein diacylglyceryl transferase [Synergistaceae bacterium]|nr:prolipoprotein diacylglyceryl transferase [Synergistaceae bacterium]
MYPTLIQFGSFRIDTYSVIWFIALSLAIIWSIKRLALYELDEDESRRIMAVSFLFMILGAMTLEHIHDIPLYIANPSSMPSLTNWGLSEFGAVLGAFIAAFIQCMFSKKISFIKLCDAAIIPAMLSIVIGRWGCFLNGCCVGLPTKFFMAVHFPFDSAGVMRHPVQIYYSVIAFVIVIILLYAEKKILPVQKKNKNYYSVIAPLGIILYALMRFAIVPVRDEDSIWVVLSDAATYQVLACVFPLVCIWLMYSLVRLKADSSYK